VRPLVNELATLIIGSKEFYDLPRKFNIAYDGGGLISAVEDTNDIGASAVKIGENSEGIEPGVYFRIALGGVTGHQTFASDWGVIVKPEQLNDVMVALLRVFIEFGDRTNRKKARFKYVIEDKGLDGVLVETEKHAQVQAHTSCSGFGRSRRSARSRSKGTRTSAPIRRSRKASFMSVPPSQSVR
jgi:ferredoxin-nitrite reductase